MWPFKKREPIPEVKPEYRNITLCKVASKNRDYEIFFVTSTDAEKIRSNPQAFVDIVFYHQVFGEGKNYGDDSRFFGYRECEHVSFNVQQVTFVGEPFDSKELLNFKPLREYLLAVSQRQFTSGLWVSR